MATAKTTTAVKNTKTNAKPAAVRKPRTPKAEVKVAANTAPNKKTLAAMKEAEDRKNLEEQIRNLQVCNDNQRVIIENMQATARSNADLIEKLQTERDDTLRGMYHVESQMNAALGRNERLQTLLGEKTLDIEKLLSSEKTANFEVQQLRGKMQDLQERNSTIRDINGGLNDEVQRLGKALKRIPSFIRAIFGVK